MPEDALLPHPPVTIRDHAARPADPGVATAARSRRPLPPVRLRSLPGVYGPAEDSRVLARVLEGEDLRGARVLDLCTGTGLQAVTAARAGAAQVAAVDVSRRAVLTARMNLRRNGGRGVVARGDLLRAAPDGDFDVVVSNPPYVPAEDDALPTRGRARAWDGGRDGRAVLDRICTEAPARLAPGGRILLVHSHVCGAERTLELLREQGLEAEVVLRHRLAFGPVMRARQELLREAGLVADGDDHEDLVVVRGVRSAGSPA